MRWTLDVAASATSRATLSARLPPLERARRESRRCEPEPPNSRVLYQGIRSHKTHRAEPYSECMENRKGKKGEPARRRRGTDNLGHSAAQRSEMRSESLVRARPSPLTPCVCERTHTNPTGDLQWTRERSQIWRPSLRLPSNGWLSLIAGRTCACVRVALFAYRQRLYTSPTRRISVRTTDRGHYCVYRTDDTWTHGHVCSAASLIPVALSLSLRFDPILLRACETLRPFLLLLFFGFVFAPRRALGNCCDR